MQSPSPGFLAPLQSRPLAGRGERIMAGIRLRHSVPVQRASATIIAKTRYLTGRNIDEVKP